MTQHVVRLEKFEGPLDLLLQLIEQSELSISDVSLSEVTEQYLAYLDAHAELEPDELADFLVVAAKLLVLKSRVLLPNLFADDEDEEDTGGLAQQLELYRKYVEVSKDLYASYRDPQQRGYARERAWQPQDIGFHPPSSLTSDVLTESFSAVLKRLEAFTQPAPEVIRRTISLQERIASLRSVFTRSKTCDFGEILSDAKTRTDVIVSFLALLELIKQRQVMAHQEGETSITITTVEYANS